VKVRAYNILIASVGGQGGLTLSRIIAEAAVRTGMSVRTGETLGMAQRYGAVVSFVRVGESVKAPIFGPGEADSLLGLEIVETLRNLHYAKPGALVIASDEYRPPISTSIAGSAPPKESLLAELRERGTIIVPAKRIAEEAGNPRAANMALLGVFNALTNLLPDEAVEASILTVLPGRAGETSVETYRRGRKWAEQLKNSEDDQS